MQSARWSFNICATMAKALLLASHRQLSLLAKAPCVTALMARPLIQTTLTPTAAFMNQPHSIRIVTLVSAIKASTLLIKI